MSALTSRVLQSLLHKLQSSVKKVMHFQPRHFERLAHVRILVPQDLTKLKWNPATFLGSLSS